MASKRQFEDDGASNEVDDTSMGYAPSLNSTKRRKLYRPSTSDDVEMTSFGEA